MEDNDGVEGAIIISVLLGLVLVMVSMVTYFGIAAEVVIGALVALLFFTLLVISLFLGLILLVRYLFKIFKE